MRILASAALILFLFSVEAFAIEHLPCQRLLQGSVVVLPDGQRIKLERNQIVLRGSLTEHWEQGMEDQTDFAIEDEMVDNMISHHPFRSFDSMFPVEEGDLVYLLNDDGSVKARGYHTEFQEEETVEFEDKEVTVNPNRPRLLLTKKMDVKAIGDLLYRKHFQNGGKAVIVSRVRDIKLINENLRDKWDEYLLHQRNPARWVSVGFANLVEISMVEDAHSGVIKLASDGSVILESQDGRMELQFLDRLFLIDSQGTLLADFRLVDPAQVLKLRQLIRRASSAVIFRRRPGPELDNN